MQQMFVQSAEPKGVGVCTGVYPAESRAKHKDATWWNWLICTIISSHFQRLFWLDTEPQHVLGVDDRKSISLLTLSVQYWTSPPCCHGLAR